MYLPGTYANGFAPRDGMPRYLSLWRGCVGAWNPGLGPTGTTLFDWGPTRSHGTLTNMVPADDWVTAGGGYALEFGASSPRQVQISSSAKILDAAIGAVAMWIYPISWSSPTANPALFSSRTGAWIEFVRVSPNLVFRFPDGPSGWPNRSEVSIAEPATGRWHFVVGQWNSSIGGWVSVNSSKSTNATPWTPGTVSGSAAIGNVHGLNFSFRGYIDGVRSYNRNLSDTEVSLLGRRRGIAYEMAPRRRSHFSDAGFRAWWARKSQMIGAGV